MPRHNLPRRYPFRQHRICAAPLFLLVISEAPFRYLAFHSVAFDERPLFLPQNVGLTIAADDRVPRLAGRTIVISFTTQVLLPFVLKP